MKRFKLNLSDNPSFNSVTGLTNITFDPTTYVENRMATEEQISQLYNRIVEDEIRRDRCCRDIIIWEAHVQIVRMNTLNLTGTNADVLSGGGAVISTFDENVSIGTMRRGLSYTVTFPIKWDDNLYVKRNASTGTSTCGIYTTNNADRIRVNYRIVENETIRVCESQATSNNNARFWVGAGAAINATGALNNNRNGHIINSSGDWGSFVHDIKDDGTVTITDHRRNDNFDIIRFYTQWILRRTADNQMIPDPE